MAKRKETVKQVIDGESFTTSVRKRPVRLICVRVPRSNPKLAKEATLRLRRLIGGEKVEVQPLRRDIYGRAVAVVDIGDVSINAEMSNWLATQGQG